MPTPVFKKGQSGNHAGRPVGIGSSIQLRKLITPDDIRDVLETVVQAAKGGDMAAAKILLDRTIPVLKPQTQITDNPITPSHLRGDGDNSYRGFSRPEQINASAADITASVLNGSMAAETGIELLKVLREQSAMFIESGKGVDLLQGRINLIFDVEEEHRVRKLKEQPEQG
ncbi:DUF5681 domain-containing protein [Crenothrix sp.]|uniref:DUF5681 domain-containing protein n=1 Tax=Crenothrix sp. TaxID=3100433 RepID=UPI00374D71FF